MVTQEDIAKKLNISRTTVARAFAGKKVKEETRQKVLEEARKMGYEKNFVAARLASSKKISIYAFMMATIDEGYYQEIVNGMTDSLKTWGDYNFAIHIITTDLRGKNPDDEQMEQFFKAIHTDQVDGVILSAITQTNLNWVSRICEEKNIPLMSLDCLFINDKFCHVGSDYFVVGTYSAAMIANLMGGKGNLLTLSYDEGFDMAPQRMKGFFHKMKEFEEIQVQNIDLKEMSLDCYMQTLEEACQESFPKAIYAPYHVEYIAEFLKKHQMQHKVITISNGVNSTVEEHLMSGAINAIVSVRPYIIGSIACNNFFRYFFRPDEVEYGIIDPTCIIYLKETYVKHDRFF